MKYVLTCVVCHSKSIMLQSVSALIVRFGVCTGSNTSAFSSESYNPE